MEINVIQALINLLKDAISTNTLNKTPRLKKGFISLAIAGACIGSSANVSASLSYEQNEAMIKTMIPLSELSHFNDVLRIKHDMFSQGIGLASAPVQDINSLKTLRNKLVDAYEAYSESLTGDQRHALKRLIRVVDLWVENDKPLTPGVIQGNMKTLANNIVPYCHAFKAHKNGIGLFCESSENYYANGGLIDKQYRQRNSNIIYRPL